MTLWPVILLSQSRTTRVQGVRKPRTPHRLQEAVKMTTQLWRPQVGSLQRYGGNKPLIPLSRSLPQVQSGSWSLADFSREATKAAFRLGGGTDTRSVRLPSNLTSGTPSSRYPNVCHASSPHHQVPASGYPTVVCIVHCTFIPRVSHGIIQVTREASVDVDRLRLELREVFDEFLARANTVLDRYTAGL